MEQSAPAERSSLRATRDLRQGGVKRRTPPSRGELATPSLKESQEDTCGRFMRTEPVRWYGRVRCTFGCAHAVVLYLYTPLQSPLEACFLFCK